MGVAHVGLVHRDPCECKVKGFRAVSSIERNVSKRRHLQGVRHSMPKLGCWSYTECVEGHLLFIRVIVSSFSGQHVSALVHVCSTSPDKEVHGSLCQGVALLCGPMPRSHFP